MPRMAITKQHRLLSVRRVRLLGFDGGAINNNNNNNNNTSAKSPMPIWNSSKGWNPSTHGQEGVSSRCRWRSVTAPWMGEGGRWRGS
eukprot:scaffold718_cov342-Pavlova_lutheri.AAC.52